MKRIRLFAVAAALLAGVSAFGMVPAAAAASQQSPQSVVCTTLGRDAGCKAQPPNGVSLNGTIATVVNILSTVVGIIAIIMVIISGLKYITANGDSSKITSARHTLTYALVGIVVAAMAQVLVKFVLHRVTS